jgi:mRNA-degrading endonuclease toxin of MazEF toxin-antitoxin module
VVLDQDDAPWTGCVLVDELETIRRHEVTRDAGASRKATMRRVDAALRVAMGL